MTFSGCAFCNVHLQRKLHRFQGNTSCSLEQDHHLLSRLLPVTQGAEWAGLPSAKVTVKTAVAPRSGKANPALCEKVTKAGGAIISRHGSGKIFSSHPCMF